jgi:hypothetical protein
VKNSIIKNQTVRKFKSDLRFLSKIIPFRVGGSRASNPAWLNSNFRPNKNYNITFAFNPLMWIKSRYCYNSRRGMKKLFFYNTPWEIETGKALVVGGAA